MRPLIDIVLVGLGVGLAFALALVPIVLLAIGTQMLVTYLGVSP